MDKKVKKKVGRKKSLVVTDKVLEKIETLSGQGLTQYQIYGYFGMGKSAWYNLKLLDKRIYESIRKGKSKAISFVSGKLYDLVKERNITAIIFYLKTQAGWREKTTLKIESAVKSKDPRIDTVDSIEASKIYQDIMTGVKR